MFKIGITKKDIFFYGFFFLFSVPLLLLSNENLSRSIFVLLSFLLPIIVYLITKKPLLSAILFTFFILPFNITIQIPSPVSILGTPLSLYDPYVNGIYVNYLVPTISILDLCAVFLLLSLVLENGFKYLLVQFKKYYIPLLLFFFYIVFQTIYIGDFLNIFNSLRIIIYIITFIFSIQTFAEGYWVRYGKQILLLCLLSVGIQLVVGYLQFRGGSSLGLSFLGESQVVNGMQGSSFIFLNEQIYLRAYGTFPHPNVLGGYLVLMICIGFRYLHVMKDFFKFIPISLIVLSLLLLLFTFSRISLLLALFVVGVEVFLFITKRSKKKVFAFSLPLLLERFMNLFSGGDTSWDERVSLLKAFLRVFKENFLLGVGNGNFVSAMDGFVPRTVSGILLQQPVHNVFALILSEYGILGFLFLSFLFGFVYFKSLKRFSILSFVLLLVLVVLCSFDHYFFSLPQGMLTFGLILLVSLL